MVCRHAHFSHEASPAAWSRVDPRVAMCHAVDAWAIGCQDCGRLSCRAPPPAPALPHNIVPMATQAATHPWVQLALRAVADCRRWPRWQARISVSPDVPTHSHRPECRVLQRPWGCGPALTQAVQRTATGVCPLACQYGGHNQLRRARVAHEDADCAHRGQHERRATELPRAAIHRRPLQRPTFPHLGVVPCRLGRVCCYDMGRGAARGPGGVESGRCVTCGAVDGGPSLRV